MSYILEALRKSERLRRQSEDEPLVRLTAAPPPRKSRWRIFALVFSAVTNVAVLAYLFGPAMFQNRRVAERDASGPDRAAGTAAIGRTQAELQPMVGSPPATEDMPRKAETIEVDKPQSTKRPDKARQESAPSGRKAAEIRPDVPAGPPNRLSRENVRQRGAIAQKVHPSQASPAASEDFPQPVARILPRPPVTDFDRSRPAELSESATDGLPKPKINVYAYNARVDGDRFVIIRNRRYREGDRIEEGPIVRRIEEHAMTLEYAGQTYKIPRP